MRIEITGSRPKNKTADTPKNTRSGKKKKVEFSKKWLIACGIVSVIFTAASYILSAFDKNPVEELSVNIVQIVWGSSTACFLGYVGQNSVRAVTSSKYGLPADPTDPDRMKGVDTQDECK